MGLKELQPIRKETTQLSAPQRVNAPVVQEIAIFDTHRAPTDPETTLAFSQQKIDEAIRAHKHASIDITDAKAVESWKAERDRLRNAATQKNKAGFEKNEKERARRSSANEIVTTELNEKPRNWQKIKRKKRRKEEARRMSIQRKSKERRSRSLQLA